MMAAGLLALQFMQASLASVLAGCGALAVLALAGRRWPALALSRSTWLMAQVLTVAAFLLVMAPQAARLSVMPPIELAPPQQSASKQSSPQQSAPQQSASPATSPFALPEPGAVDGAPADGESSGRWLVSAAQAWLAVYLVGVAVAGGRLVLGQRALRRLLRGATALTDLAGHRGFDAAPAPGVAVVETEVAVSPMLVGVWRPVLLLPRHLRDFAVVQQQMIIAHELTHLRRNDPLWMAASIALQTALWFNPALRKLGERLTWAQELSCDQQVLSGRAQPQRKAYAAALVGQLKLQQGAFGAAIAFGGISVTSLTARMLIIRQGGAPALGRLGRGAVMAGFGAVFAASLVLQPAFAWRVPTAPMVTEPAPVAWRAPLENVRVSGLFGVISPLTPTGHHGIDFIARTGTPVLAAADGKVVSSTDLDAGGAKYGKTVQIVHANGLRSVYAHLDRRLVAAGDVVRAGQPIGLSGATGKVTGPHLHFEVRDGARTLDPATVLTGLDAHATPSALRARARLTAN